MIWFLFKNFKYIILALIFFAAGFKLAWYIENLKIEKIKAEEKRLLLELKQCTDANQSNLETIERLKSEVKRTNKLCSERIKLHGKILKRLQEIDSLEPNKTEEGNETATFDPILFELNKLFSGS